ncbi:MAG TPA: hypothetical protein VEZ46_04290 [Mycobacteriales bacterium]|nr:hypothetical protein [Mycobacteriales bacterium]
MTTSTPAVSWTRRLQAKLARRIAFSVGALVLLTGVAPAMANAAGGSLPNPVAIALRSSSRTVANLLAPARAVVDTGGACPAATPTVTGEPAASPTPEPTPSSTPAAPGDAADADEPACNGETTPTSEPTPTPTPTPAASPSEVADDEADDAAADSAGRIVSTVARCAPKGKDALLAAAGPGLTNHGAFVQVAAAGGTLTTSFGTFDLATPSGADAFCAAADAAAAELGVAKKVKADKADKAVAKAAKVKAAKAAKTAKVKAAKAKNAKAAKAKPAKTDRVKSSGSKAGGRAGKAAKR